MDYLFGLVTGLCLFCFYMIFRNYLNRRKVGQRIIEYKKSNILRKLTDSIRHTVFKYGIKDNNSDFSLNVFVENELRIQILHRSHFPDICESESDIKFGLALYLPINGLNANQQNKLITIFKEESELFLYEEVPFQYYIVDLGKRVRFTSYLLTRILKEVFSASNENHVSFELYSEGKLPYVGLPENSARPKSDCSL